MTNMGSLRSVQVVTWFSPVMVPWDAAGEHIWELSNLFVGGLSQLDSPPFTGVNKVLTIVIVT